MVSGPFWCRIRVIFLIGLVSLPESGFSATDTAKLAAPRDYSRVEKILSARDILITAETREQCRPGNVFALTPQDTDPDDPQPSDQKKTEDREEPEPLGFAEAYERYGEKQCLAKVKSHSQSALIRARDSARALDLRKSGQNIPGRYDLVREGHKEWAAMYKPTVYGGYLFGQTASTLDKNEWLIGFGPVMYGIRNNFQADITYARVLEKVFEFGLKYKFYSNEDMRFSLYFQNSRFWEIGKDAWAAELHYDSQSNSRSMSHTKLHYASKIPKKLALTDESKKDDSSLELITTNEWILKGWNRILFGPKFVAGDELDLGVLFSYLYVRESFNAALNLSVNSVRKIDLGKFKQAIWFDLFLRF